MNWPHTVHTTTREGPRYIFTIFMIILFLFFKNFKSSITPLIFIFITYYNFEKKKETLFFKANFIYIYIYIL